MINKKNNLLTKKKPIANKSNKYAIRKFTVGTASIVIGATLLFGLGHNEAKARRIQYKTLKIRIRMMNYQTAMISLVMKKRMM
ncbi:Ser-Asp rich fibrinogen-binding, bone sialoprotein-binding protein [Staphylococcus epidermidis 36-1]|nr:Ser-Asp rich fibrinogen-binding, bone sialoprotein-binding protein [Staphylococcus epidermidis 36-1]